MSSWPLELQEKTPTKHGSSKQVMTILVNLNLDVCRVIRIIVEYLHLAINFQSTHTLHQI